jgi:DNA-binding MarR family transcriptional regulator
VHSSQLKFADEPETAAPPDWRPLPQTLGDLGLPEIFLAHLALKQCFYLDVFNLGELAERLRLPPAIVSQLVDYLRKEKFVEFRGADPLRPAVNPLSLAHRLALTESGKRRAAQLLEYDAYTGPAPVPLPEYFHQVARQTIRLTEIKPDRLRAAMEGLVISPELVEQLGAAAMSGKPLFLYGPSGNGKTTIALRLAKIWDDVILVPYALYVEGQVIRVFDAITHQPAATAAPETGDRRWVRCRRPTVVMGGELVLEMLDLAFNPTLNYYEAPLQLKANSGLLLVDDFGRQQWSPEALLNRWIIPLENRQDFLRLKTGQKFAIPFDHFLIFATNLEPRSLVDDAFLRRLRAKVKVDHVSREQFAEIFRLVCQGYDLAFDPGALKYLLHHHYDAYARPLSACHPRDLLEHILDWARFHGLTPALTPESLDRACRSYFVY